MNDTKKRLPAGRRLELPLRGVPRAAELRSAAGGAHGCDPGVVSMLQKLKATFPPIISPRSSIPKGKTFRDAIYPEYKATRQAMPEDLRQADRAAARDHPPRSGWPVVVVDGVEADDVIGTLVRHAGAQGWDSVHLHRRQGPRPSS
jgi:DNA polymerase-1